MNLTYRVNIYDYNRLATMVLGNAPLGR